MAPEQAAGRLDELDHRTDIYGLGAILFAIISGYAPHEKTQKESVDSGIGTRGMISAIASGNTPFAREVNSRCRSRLEAICCKAMARRRYGRYQSATDLAEDVQRWMAGEPVTAYHESTWQRAGRWVSQHQRLSQSLAGDSDGCLGRTHDARHVGSTQSLGRVERPIRRDGERCARGGASIAQRCFRAGERRPFPCLVTADPGHHRRAAAMWKERDEEVWRGRLETIFTGMLRSNPDYLALSFESTSGSDASDIVRVERNPADPSLIRVLPKGRLQVVESDALMAAVAALEPGDVRLSLETRARHATASSDSDRLSVATPVYGDTLR